MVRRICCPFYFLYLLEFPGSNWNSFEYYSWLQHFSFLPLVFAIIIYIRYVIYIFIIRWLNIHAAYYYDKNHTYTCIFDPFRGYYLAQGHTASWIGDVGCKLEPARDCVFILDYTYCLMEYLLLHFGGFSSVLPTVLFPLTSGIYSDVFIIILLLKWALQRSPDHRTAFYWFSFLLFKTSSPTYLILPITSFYNSSSMLSFCSLILGSLLQVFFPCIF